MKPVSCSFDEPGIKLSAYAWQGALEDDSQHPNMGLDLYAVSDWRDPWEADFVVEEDYIVCRRVDRTAFLRNVQRIAECIVHFFLIEELVAEDDQLVIVD